MTNVTISIPPFPSQDLAKLVLGYLAEEQLMTAYDEFLQASPYLDALRNEYDRIFMTSLKNILAEYRAVKIYVETCKPFMLRRKLFQCSNLLEIVKFLVSNVDVNKLHAQEGSIDKAGESRHSVTKSISCDECISLNLKSCVCGISQSTSQLEAPLERSVETTSLDDLPGNTTYKKKIIKTPDITRNITQSISSSDQIQDGRLEKPSNCSENLISTNTESDTTDSGITSLVEKQYTLNPSLSSKDQCPESGQRVQSLKDVFKYVNRHESDNKKDGTDPDVRKGILLDTSEQFSIDVDSSDITKSNVPDSSTSENIVIQSSKTETENATSFIKKSTPRPQILIKDGNEQKNLKLSNNSLNLPRLRSKDSFGTVENKKSENLTSSQVNLNSPKITILSDIKVGNNSIMPSVLKSTPAQLVQMQTLFINGTPAYQESQPQKFTEDEIMAMPTIILVPSSDKMKATVPTVTQNNKLDCSAASLRSSTGPSLSPLVIDVSASDATSNKMSNTFMDYTNEPTKDNMLVKTVEVTSHASLPKDNTLTALKTSTPHVLPPVKKSSSTPRRTSHIRVLDFTTPRRILHETINEQDVNKNSPIEVAHTGEASSPAINNTDNEETITRASNLQTKVDSSGETNKGATKENKASVKLFNWDSELRALAFIGNGSFEKSDTTRKSKPKKTKGKVSGTDINIANNKSEDAKTVKSKKKRKVTPKVKKSKNRKKSVDIAEVIIDEKEEKTLVPIVKPTINIISRTNWPDSAEIDKSQNKSNHSDEHINTPELEKMSLQNEIGAKLNISDLLETPYKQALYDIQMETPKFLGPDIPGDPLSDIKIMNIPTPRFLNSKLPQNTPSSYSSRPTDYSSGGSYYKPDEQDYELANEIIEGTLCVSAESNTNNEKGTTEAEKVNVDNGCEGKSRPVRKCATNVSYTYGIPIISSKIKDLNDNADKSSTSTDISIKRPEKKTDKPKIPELDKDNKNEKKREPKKRGRKPKLSMKKDTPKTFIKIKPRRTTPVKEIVGKGRKKTNEISPMNYIKPQPRKLVSSKERNASFMSSVAPVSTKSRRKSSTPRKLNSSIRFNSESSEINSPEQSKHKAPEIQKVVSLPKAKVISNTAVCSTNSDTEQAPLRWSDESQESHIKPIEAKAQQVLTPINAHPLNESDDISRIKEYINETVPNYVGRASEGEGTLLLIQRGFDVETARMIERDLLEAPIQNESIQKLNILEPSLSPKSHEKNNKEVESKQSYKSTVSDCSTSNNLQIIQDDDDEHDWSLHECNEDTVNYFTFKYDELTFTPSKQVKLKETFSMEICIEDDVAIRLRAIPFKTVFEHDCKFEIVENCDDKSAEKCEGPCSYDTLFTPRKAQCYEIFDSTLTSLDTPLKLNSPKAQDSESVAEIVLEVERLETDIKQKSESKKRKRVQNGTSDECSNGSKRIKPDTPYLLNSATIQNIDIESVLSKLHGP